MRIMQRSILRVKPRTYREFAIIKFELGDLVRHVKHPTLRVCQAPLETVSVARSVTKAGRPLGPWLFVYGHRLYSVEGENDDAS